VAGDRIIRFGTWENGTYDDLKTAVQIAANPVHIKLMRQGHEYPIEVVATLNGSPIKLGAGWIDDAAIPGSLPIVQVVADSPADRAGIITGDVVIEMNGRPPGNSDEFVKRVVNENGPLQLLIDRNGYLRKIEVDLLDRAKDVSDRPKEGLNETR
jgi:S1-C subfamily serine protease